MKSEHQVPIWFFIGGTLLIYGLLISGYGVYALWNPTEVQRNLLASKPDASWFSIHPDIWWGAIMAALGAFYCYRFNPLRPGETLTGRSK